MQVVTFTPRPLCPLERKAVKIELGGGGGGGGKKETGGGLGKKKNFFSAGI